MNDIICHCFGYTIENIRADVLAHGKSTIAEAIKAAKQDGRCRCKETNPTGR